jgi:3-oxoacid CoA-transferase B subunit
MKPPHAVPDPRYFPPAEEPHESLAMALLGAAAVVANERADAKDDALELATLSPPVPPAPAGLHGGLEGLPTGVTQYVPHDAGVFFQSDNGIIGMGARPPEGMEDIDLTDAAGAAVTAVPGAATIDSGISFGLIRGGHVEATVLGGLQVDEAGHLANWMVPGKMVPGMGGAMDLVSGARRVIVAMQHSARGKPKIVPVCTLPLTANRRVTLVVTELCVIEPTDAGLVVRELAPGVAIEAVIEASSARLIVPKEVSEMQLA